MGQKKAKPPIPLFETPLIESHCHLDYLGQHDLDELLKKSFDQGIEKIVTISVSPDNIESVFELSKNQDRVYCTQGIHPHEAKGWSDKIEAIMNKNLPEKHVLAVGEIGLDYHYDNSPRDKQREVFERQLQLACDHDLPVVIHSRDAEQDTMDILRNFNSNKLKRRGVIHSFTSKIELAEFVLDQGFYLGFNGIITFKSAEKVRKAVQLCPMDRLLLETDAPFLTPVPYRGRENAPYYLPFVAEKMAEQKGCETEALLAQVYQNTQALFQFS
jgi:TatD DNase family protein